MGTQARRLRRGSARLRGRDRRHPRPQRQREVDDHQGDPGHEPRDGRQGGVRGPRRHSRGLEVQRARGHGAHPLRAFRLRRPHGARQPLARRSEHRRREQAGRAPRARLRAVPDPARQVDAARWHPLGRAAAHGQPRPRAHVRPEASDARRTFARARAERRPPDLRHGPAPRRHRRSLSAAARAERRPSTAHRRPRLRHALWASHPRRDRRSDARPRAAFRDIASSADLVAPLSVFAERALEHLSSGVAR